MSEFKGSKGNWSVEQCKEFETLHLIWSTSEKSILDNGTLIARTCYAPLSKANAQLIAHAPQMLEILKQIDYTLSVHGKVDAGTNMHIRLSELIQQATTIK